MSVLQQNLAKSVWFVSARKAGLSVFFLSLILGLFAGSGAATAETLLRALAAAYNFSPTLKAQRAVVRARDEEVPRARSGYRPTLRSEYTVTHTHTRTNPRAATDGDNTARAFSIDLSQPIFRGFRTINSVREADANVFAQRETLRLTEQTVLLNAVTVFMDVVRDSAVVGHRRSNVRNLERQLQASRDRLEVGEATRTDVAQSQARLSLAQSQLSAADAALRTSRAGYMRVIGHAPKNLRRPPLLDGMLPLSLSQALQIGDSENPEILAAIFLEKASRHAIDRINGEFLPEVSIGANYSKRWDPSPLTRDQEVLTITGRVAVPLYQAGEVSARSRQSVHTASQRQREIEAARDKIKADVISAWAQRQSSRAQVQSDLAQVKANQTAVAGVREELKEGQRSVLDVLNAEQELVNALVLQEGSKRDLVVNAFSLLSTIGRLSATDLRLGVAHYDVKAHYDDVRRKWWGPGRYGQDPYDY